jgi:glycerophosphoryl diester phosphodiesterase
VAARPPTHAFLDHPAPLAFAHRGGTESAPENTLRAFRAAVGLGYRYLETDVHLTADGVLVSFHDDRLDRVTDRTGRISDLTLAEVRRARIGGSDPVPTFDELLEEFPDVRFNVDPKADVSVLALAQALRRHGAVDRVCIGAFSDDRLRRLRALLGDELCTSAGPREISRMVAASRVPAVRARGGRPPYRCLQVPVRHRNVTIVTEAFLDTAHARGCQVHVWTVDDPAEMHRLLDLGVDGLMTDLPSVLRDVLESRGEWP